MRGVAAADSPSAGPLAVARVEPTPERSEHAPTASGLHDADGREIDPREIAAELESLDPVETIRWAIETFHPSLYFATSFQKTSSMIVDIAHSIEPQARFFYLDTEILFTETHITRDALAARYGIEFDRYAGIGLEEQADLYGDKLWERQPDACCGIRKVEPMRAALSGIDCWVSGIRRVDSVTRTGAAKFGWDRRFGLWKLNPLADLTDADVWSYLREHEVPYNPLHDAGYPSIGCTHCTRPPGVTGDPRSGRWADAHKTECGLHG